MVAAITATPDTAGGYIALSLTGFGSTTSANVVRSDLAGNVVSVRNGDPLSISGGTAATQDYEVPTDTAVTYEARDVTLGTILATSSPSTLASGGAVWLGHPGRPTLNMRVTIREWVPGTRRARAGTFDVIGKTLPVVRTMRRAGPEGRMVLRVDSFTERDQLFALIEDGYPLLLRPPTSPNDWGIPAMYLSIGDVSEDLFMRVPWAMQKRAIPMDWTQVDRPAGLSQAGPGFSWADIATAYPTWTALIAANPTWNDVIDGVP